MTPLARHETVSTASVVVPLALLLALGGALAMQTGIVDLTAATMPGPQTVVIEPREFTYRAAGDFYKNDMPVDGPLLTERVTKSLEITKYQVSVSEYGHCVDAGACAAPELAEEARAADFPVTGVNYDDATAYAGWLSQQTGEVWRLPTDAQLAFAAGSKFPDDALGVDPDSRNPALRWLADYKREAARKASLDPHPLRQGQFGENELGLADFGGNIWEWTTTCIRRFNLEDGFVDGGISGACGVFVTVGKHRSPMSSFIRDPKSGGCSVGAPPDNLGFRLVKDDRWYAPVLFAFGK